MQKRASGPNALPHSTAHWILCMLTGNWPIHYYIIREFCRYWNRLMDVARHVRPVGEALKMQRRLLRNRKKCWIAQWLDTLYTVVPDDAESWLQINSFQHIDEELYCHMSELHMSNASPTLGTLVPQNASIGVLH